MWSLDLHRLWSRGGKGPRKCSSDLPIYPKGFTNFWLIQEVTFHQTLEGCRQISLETVPARNSQPGPGADRHEYLGQRYVYEPRKEAWSAREGGKRRGRLSGSGSRVITEFRFSSENSRKCSKPSIHGSIRLLSAFKGHSSSSVLVGDVRAQYGVMSQ